MTDELAGLIEATPFNTSAGQVVLENHRRRCRSRLALCGWRFYTAVLCGLLTPGVLMAQWQSQQQFVDPQKMLSEMFSEESDEERADVEKVPVSKQEESQFGNQMLEHAVTQWRQRGAEVTDQGRDHEYLTVLVERVHPLMKNAKRHSPIRVLVADTDAVDARSFPGGTIVVLRGMIDFCESEAALVGVLGHELSHIDRGHQLYQLRRWKKAQSSFQSASNLNEMMKSGMGMAKMFMRPFRPAEELEADRDGARWAFQLGYDPTEMAKVFQRLANRDRGKQIAMPDFLRSHPYNADRYQAVVKQSDVMQRRAGNPQLFVGQAELKSRTAKDVVGRR